MKQKSTHTVQVHILNFLARDMSKNWQMVVAVCAIIE